MNRYKDTMNKISADKKLIDKTLQRLEQPNKRRYYIPILAVCMLMMVFFLPINKTQAETYISLDINPSIQIVVDKNDKVIDVVAYNEDGEELLSDTDYKDHNYLDVCKDLLKNKLGHYTDNGYLVVAISNKHHNNDAYLQSLQNIMNEYYIRGNVTECDPDIIDDATKHHMSIGKYNESQILMGYDDTITIEDCHNMSIHEIHNEIAKHHSESNSHHGKHHE